MTTLLVDDFGAIPAAPLANAVDFHGLHLGMDKCQARQQCYFIDACRVASSTLIDAGAIGFFGDPIIHGGARHSILGQRSAPIYYSTVAGSRAYGRPETPSIFTEALLKAFSGAGSDDVADDWRVYTDTLNRGIHFLLRRMTEGVERVDELVRVGGELTSFTLHYLVGKPPSQWQIREA